VRLLNSDEFDERSGRVRVQVQIKNWY
jgi:hypothetical protein